MNNLLDTIITGTRPQPRRCLLYGPHGIGKSTWAAKADGHVFIDIEDGLSNIYCSRLPVVSDWNEVRSQIAALVTQDHDYKVLIIDTADALEGIVTQHVVARDGKQSVEDYGYGKGYVKVAEFFRDTVLKALDTVRSRRGMHVVLTAHSKIVKFEAPDLDSYDRYEPKLNKHVSALIQEWADEVFFTNYKVMTRKTDEGFGNRRTLAVGTGEGGAGERKVWTVERPSALAKSRLDLPAEMDLDWSAYAHHFPQADNEDQQVIPADTVNEDEQKDAAIDAEQIKEAS